MSNVIAVADTLTMEHCYECGMLFAMPTDFVGYRRKDGDTVFCPAGHEWHYNTEEDLKAAAAEKRAQEPDPPTRDEYLRAIHRAEQSEARAAEAEAKAADATRNAVAAALAAPALPTPDESGRLQCECGKRYTTAEGYILHRQRKHPEAGPPEPPKPNGNVFANEPPHLKCETCGKAYKYPASFEAHVRRHKREKAASG